MTIDVTCGLCLSRRGLVAALVDGSEELHLPPPVPEGDSERWDWFAALEAQHGLCFDLVLTDALAMFDPIGRLALAREIPVYLVPESLLGAIRQAAFPRAGPKQLAALLARIPRCQAWRPHLRRVASLSDTRQLLLR